MTTKIKKEISQLSQTFTISIIGTSGKNGSISLITKDVYQNMILNAKIFICRVINKISRKYSIDKKEVKDRIILYSGGCALADHIAVELFNSAYIKNLTIYSPCDWDYDKMQYVDNGDVKWFNNPGKLANSHHLNFSKQLRKDSLMEISEAIKKGAIFNTDCKGFHARNTRVANCDYVLAFTFSENNEPDDGGTLDTWNKCKTEKTHISLQEFM